MTDWLLAQVPTYGMWLLTACTFASCLALPMPASILMLGPAASWRRATCPCWGSFGAALGRAVAGDELGFAASRYGGAGLIDRLGSRAAPSPAQFWPAAATSPRSCLAVRSRR